MCKIQNGVIENGAALITTIIDAARRPWSVVGPDHSGRSCDRGSAIGIASHTVMAQRRPAMPFAGSGIPDSPSGIRGSLAPGKALWREFCPTYTSSLQRRGRSGRGTTEGWTSKRMTTECELVLIGVLTLFCLGFAWAVDDSVFAAVFAIEGTVVGCESVCRSL